MIDVRTHKFIRILRELLALLSSGAISAICLSLVVSTRFHIIEQARASFLVLFMIWQVTSLTIAKFGIDQVVFTSVTANKNIYFSSLSLIKKKSIYIVLFIATICYMLFNTYAAFALFVSIPMDIYSLIRINELNANEKFIKTSIANLWNYPAFFLGIFISSVFLELSDVYILIWFCVCSFLRAMWLQLNRVPTANMMCVESNANIRMVIHQSINALMCRLDQVILSFSVFSHISLKDLDLNTYLLLAKYFEIAGNIVPIIGAVIFPRIYISLSEDANTQRASMRKRRMLCCSIWLIGITGFFVGYVSWLSTAEVLRASSLPFLLSAFLILPLNLIIYSMLRVQRVDGLIRNQTLALFIGCLLWFSLYISGIMEHIGWLVTFQLLIFTLLSKALPWGEPTHTYTIR